MARNIRQGERRHRKTGWLAIACLVPLLLPGHLDAAIARKALYDKDLQCLSVFDVLAKAKPSDRDHQDSRRMFMAILSDDAAALKMSRTQMTKDIVASDQRVFALMRRYMQMPEKQAGDRLGWLVLNCTTRMVQAMEH